MELRDENRGFLQRLNVQQACKCKVYGCSLCGQSSVEQLWSKVKAHLRKMKARTLDALYVALKDALDAVSLSDIKAWFAMACYSAA